MNGFIVKYDQEVQIPEGGCITQRKVELISARDMTHARGIWSAMRRKDCRTKDIKQVY